MFFVKEANGLKTNKLSCCCCCGGGGGGGGGFGGRGEGGDWVAEYMCSKRNTANSRPVARIV